MKLILGSASPRRLELLQQVGIVPDAIRPSDIDETPHPKELPRIYCQRMSHEKALVAELGDDQIILCADTIVSAGRKILGKPTDEADARAMLKLLSARRHQVITSVTIRSNTAIKHKTVETKVKMKGLSQSNIDSYIASGEWRGKAGSYAIQGLGASLIPSIYGSYSNVVGLPLVETINMLSTFLPNKPVYSNT